MPTYGPTFFFELRAAGLALLPIVVRPDEIAGRDELTPQQDAALQAVIDAHDPNAAVPRAIPRKTFFEELAAQSQYDAFMTWKASQAPAMKIYFDEESTFTEDAQEVQDAMTALSLTTSAFFDSALT